MFNIRRYYNSPGHLVTLKITIFTFLLLVGIVLVIFYWLFNPIRKELIFLTAVLGGLAAVYSCYYVGANLILAIHRDKIHRAFELIHMFNMKEAIDIRVFISEVVDGRNLSQIEIYKKVVEDRELRVSINSVLSLMESVSIAIQKDYAEEEVVYRYLCHIVPNFYRMLGPYIRELRVQYEDIRVCLEYETLAKKWILKKFLSTGKNIPLSLLP